MPTDTHSAAGAGQPDLEVYQTIARKVKEGSCVLFLGPAAVLAKDSDGSWHPVTDLCARFLARKYNLALAEGEDNSLPYVASLLRIRNLSTDNMLQDDVAGFYKSQAGQLEYHPMLAQLSDLKFRIIVNTTPDNYISVCYDEIAKPYQFDFYNWYKPAPGFAYDFEKNPKVMIYNLFGFAERPESLVLTYKHQLTYIKKIVSEQQNERLPDSLTNAFKDFRYHLFLGFDFEDWSLRLLLDTLYKNVRENIQPFSFPVKGERHTDPDTRVFFQGEFSMQFPHDDMETFVNTLVEQYNNLDANPVGASVEQPKAQALLLYNEATDNDGAELIQKYLRTINVKVLSLKDAVGQGDVQAWIRQNLNSCQIVLPLLSIDFFDAANNPALALLDEIVARNNPRKQFLVMPVLWKDTPIDGPLAQLDSIRPVDKVAIFGSGQETKFWAEITESLKRYVDKLPR